MNDIAQNLIHFHQMATQSILDGMYMDMVNYQQWANMRCSGEDTSLSTWEAHKREQRRHERQMEIELYGYVRNGWNA